MKTIIKITCLVLFLHQTIFAINYYVSPSGNDLNAGTSTVTAWKTFQKACNAATAGSTVYLMAGTYNEKVILNVSGTSTNRLTIRNYNSDVVIIDGTGISSQDEILNIHTKSYVTIQGLIFQNSIGNNSMGIFTDGICSNLVFKRNIIRQIYFSSNPNATISGNTNAVPFLVWGTDANTPITNLTVDSNTIYNCRTGFSEALTLDGNVDTFTVKNNLVHDITNIGILAAGNYGVCPNAANDQARNGIIKWNKTYNCISPYATSGGIYVDGGRSVVIENNISYHNGWGIEVGCEILGKTTSDITVRNNILYNNTQSGFAFGGYDYPATSGKIYNCNFSGNTIFLNDSTNSGNGEVFISYSENCVFQNNIIYTSSTDIAFAQDGALPLNLLSNYNLFYDPAGAASITFLYGGATYTGFTNYKTGTSLDLNSLIGNPNFVSVTLPNPDLHLTASSPAIDAGNPTYIAGNTEVDMDNQLRIFNTRVDMGADEFNSVSTLVFETKINEVLIYPNPSTTEFFISGDFARQTFIELYDSNGNNVLTDIIRTNFQKINIQNFSKGMYFYKVINSEGKSSNGKIIVE